MNEKQRGDDHKLYCPTCKAGRNCMDHLMIRGNDLQEQVTQLKADLATAKQGLEHYASKKRYACVSHSTFECAKCANQIYHYGNKHGYTVAQQTLDALESEKR